MKTTDRCERFEENFYATPGTMFVENMRPATLEEQQSIQEYIDKISKPTGYNFWDSFTEELDNTKCIHWECPYKHCSYHRYTTSTLPLCDDLPIYMPKSKEAMKDCMSYLDI